MQEVMHSKAFAPNIVEDDDWGNLEDESDIIV